MTISKTIGLQPIVLMAGDPWIPDYHRRLFSKGGDGHRQNDWHSANRADGDLGDDGYTLSGSGSTSKSGCPYSTGCPLATKAFTMRQGMGARTSFMIFIASMAATG
jgi:hypothetical protein